MRELDYKESWTPKNRCFWTVVLEKTLESPLDYKEIQPDHPKGDQSWVFIGRSDVEAETPILQPPNVKSWLIGKDSDARGDWGQEEKGMTEDEMAGWHHWLYGRGSEWTLGVGDRQGGLDCCASWGCKESDTTEWLNWLTYWPQLSYPLVCWWTSRLLPCPGYCKQCCSEHWGSCVSFNSGFLCVYAQQWDCWIVWRFNNLRYEDDTTFMAESEELKSLLMKVKQESEKVGLKLNIKKTKIMASGPITSWRIDGKQWKQWETLFVWGLQNHCRWWLQPWN